MEDARERTRDEWGIWLSQAKERDLRKRVIIVTMSFGGGGEEEVKESARNLKFESSRGRESESITSCKPFIFQKGADRCMPGGGINKHLRGSAHPSIWITVLQ
jgi:hypothetical protein